MVSIKIGIIDIDGKLPNLALMKISAFYKAAGEQVEFFQPDHKYEKLYACCLFTWNRAEAQKLKDTYGETIEIGGTGWDVESKLPPEIEQVKPDYSLYTAGIIEKNLTGGIKSAEARAAKARQIAEMGIGFTSRGCIRECPFCFVPTKEGKFHQESEIADLINPRSSLVTLYDNNLTADPHCIDKLHEIRDRGLQVNISQGIDIRLMTEEKAQALSEIKYFASLHYAWDLMNSENQVLHGIGILSRHVKKYRHMCYVLVGFNTNYEEDAYRVAKLNELDVRPYIMKYNNRTDDARLNHFARWVNGYFFRVCSFDEYKPWVREREKMVQQSFFTEQVRQI